MILFGSLAGSAAKGIAYQIGHRLTAKKWPSFSSIGLSMVGVIKTQIYRPYGGLLRICRKSGGHLNTLESLDGMTKLPTCLQVIFSHKSDLSPFERRRIFSDLVNEG